MSVVDNGTLLAGRFEVLRPLGAGALAEVFAARDTATGEEVAVKVLHAHAAADPELAARFRAELGLTRRLNHPGIVRVFELYEHQGRPFISLELLRGETLAERLERGRLPPEEARRILREALLAVQAAHAQGIVHRDLKPQNLFLLEDGRVKLLDFGLARAAGATRLTAASTVLGTPGYLAPEVLEGSGGDVRSDLYSLGAVFFELLTGRRAFPALEPFAVLRQQREGAPAVRALLPEVAEADAAVLARALTPDPEQRFLDAGQVLRALGGGLVAEPPPALPSLSPGRFDVTMRPDLFNADSLALARRFGLEAPWTAVALSGGVIARGVDQRSAEALRKVCEEHGLYAVAMPSQPSKQPRALGRWLRSRWFHFWQGLALACLACAGALAAALSSDAAHPKALLPTLAFSALIGTFYVSMISLAILPVLARKPPLLPPAAVGDPALLRLVTGVARRARRLRERIRGLPSGARLAALPLIASAEEADDACAQVMARAAHRATADDPEAEAARDRLVERMLVIGAALDEALAGAESAAAAAQQVDAALRRLRGETALALLPEADSPSASRARTPV